jgi:molecular chaperone DnaK (HSP70)
MRVGIDFGTTHTVVAVVDRGNYPVVSFDGVDAWPSLIAAHASGQLLFGSDAAAVRREPGWSVLRSIKRLLNAEAKEAMFEATDTDIAPWIVVRSNDKKRARINTMRYVLAKSNYDDKDDGVVGEPDPQIVGRALTD